MVAHQGDSARALDHEHIAGGVEPWQGAKVGQNSCKTQRSATMVDRLKFYIDAAWLAPASRKTLPVVNPATEEVLYEVALGSAADVDKAVAAARPAFQTYSLTTRQQPIAPLRKIIEAYKRTLK